MQVVSYGLPKGSSLKYRNIGQQEVDSSVYRNTDYIFRRWGEPTRKRNRALSPILRPQYLDNPENARRLAISYAHSVAFIPY